MKISRIINLTILILCPTLLLPMFVSAATILRTSTISHCGFQFTYAFSILNNTFCGPACPAGTVTVGPGSPYCMGNPTCPAGTLSQFNGICIVPNFNVTENITSSWTITGPVTMTGTGSEAVQEDSSRQTTGMYTITWSPIAGYNTPAPQSLCFGCQSYFAPAVVYYNGTYTPISYTVSASAGVGGTISPALQTVNYNNTATLTVTPNAGYTASASGCAGSLSGTIYTTGAITADCMVTAQWTATPLAIAVSPTNYPVTLPSSTISATYTLTNGTSADTNCRLLDYLSNPLNVYASCTGSMSVSAPAAVGPYGYSIQANKSSTGQTVTSNSFTVDVSAAAATTVNGACGSSNLGTFSSAPATNLCNAGTATAVVGTGPWWWSCNGGGVPVGTNASCQAFTNVVAGSCGTANGVSVATAPSANLCTYTSVAPTVTGSGPWNWTCSGANGGANASCNAPKTSAIKTKFWQF